MNGFTLAETVIVPASHGRALRVRAGDRVRITDLEGKQVGDLMAWCVADPTEYLSPAHTVTYNWRIIPRVGDVLASNRREAMFRVVADTVGYHDLIVPCCDAEAYLNRYSLADHRSCKGNLEEALAELGLDYEVQGERAINVFMKTRIGPDGAMIYEEPTHPAGSRLELDCLVDAVLALSACPQDQTPTNGWKCTPLGLERWTPTT
jgi:uncharacterized protein YcgI (DUF1989 family)